MLLPVVKSAAGCPKENFNMNIAIPVFCIPDSIVIDILSVLDKCAKADVIYPITKPVQGTTAPAKIIYNLIRV